MATFLIYKCTHVYTTKYVYIKSTTVYVPSSELGLSQFPRLSTLPILWCTLYSVHIKMKVRKARDLTKIRPTIIMWIIIIILFFCQRHRVPDDDSSADCIKIGVQNSRAKIVQKSRGKGQKSCIIKDGGGEDISPVILRQSLTLRGSILNFGRPRKNEINVYTVLNALNTKYVLE